MWVEEADSQLGLVSLVPLGTLAGLMAIMLVGALVGLMSLELMAIPGEQVASEQPMAALLCLGQLAGEGPHTSDRGRSTSSSRVSIPLEDMDTLVVAEA